MEFGDLERSADRALRRLPVPRAPETLLPRVLAAAARLARRPWYARTWFTWPIALRVGSVAAALVVMVLTVQFAPSTDVIGGVVSGYLTAAVAAAPGFLDAITALATIVQVAWRGVQPVAIIGFILLVVTLLTCGACWRIVNRLTLTSETA